MADVAARAGVSRTLVSFILSGKPGAGEHTRRRVLEVAEEIGYHPDSAARRLARGRSRTIGVLMDVRQPFQAELVTDIYPAAERLGYEVLLSANLPDRDESVPIGALLSHRCGSLILLGPTSDAAAIAELAEQVPVVLVGRDIPKRARDLKSVHTADAKGIRQAVAYLVELGHRDIHHVDGGTDPGSAERRNAYRAAMRKHGPIRSGQGHARRAQRVSGRCGGQRDADRNSAPTQRFSPAMTDARSGLLDVFTRAGVKVPEDLSLIGYDDSHLSDYPTIDLTTVRQDAAGMAHARSAVGGRHDGRPPRTRVTR